MSLAFIYRVTRDGWAIHVAAVSDRRADRYIDIINSLNPELQRQQFVVLTTVQMTKAIRSRRMMRTALIQMAKYFPDEPLYSLMLLDYYVPSKMYEEAVAALRRTYDQFDFDDAAMEARLPRRSLKQFCKLISRFTLLKFPPKKNL